MSNSTSNQTLKKFIRFGGLSGAGWLFDFAVYLSILYVVGLLPYIANFISSSLAAILVFTISREFIYDKADGSGGRRFVYYFFYSAIAIILASMSILYLSLQLGNFSIRNEIHLTEFSVAVIAKILITPPLLILNFLMSRFLNETRTI